MKRITALLIVAALLCPLFVSSLAAPQMTEAQRMSNEIEALEQYQLLLEGLSGEAAARSVSPDYYGGAYINSDGNLVVCVTDDYAVSSNTIQTYTANDDIILKTVDYTFEELSQEQDRITALFQSLQALADNDATLAANPSLIALLESIRSIRIDEEQNLLVVSIQDLSQEKVYVFRTEISSKNYIEFEEGYSNTTTADALHCTVQE